MAIVSVSRLEAKRFVNENMKNSKILMKLKDNQRRILVAILVGNNVVNILASSLAAVIAVETFGEIGVGISVFVMTFVLLIVGEVVPKAYGSRHYRTVALRVAPYVDLLEVILNPIISFFDLFAKFITKDAKPTPVLTEKELKGFFEVGVQEKVLEPQERAMFEKVLLFNDVPVKKIMVPFGKVIPINGEITVLSAAKIISNHKYTRYPVFETKKKKVIGIVRGVDVLTAISAGYVSKKVREIIWPTIFVNENELIDDVFKKFNKGHVHMGIVRDSELKTLGIVTMENIIEAIVGDFGSEDDNPRP